MHLPHRFTRHLLLVATLAVASVSYAEDLPAALFGFAKNLHYTQTTAAGSVPVAGGNASIDIDFAAGVAGSVRLPSGTVQTVAANQSIDPSFATQALLDAAFPDGTYTFTIGSAAPIALQLPASTTYPSIPRVIGGTWTGSRLVVDPTKDYVVNLASFTQYGTAGQLTYAYWSLEDAVTRADIFEIERYSIQPGEVLTQVTIPAGSLVAGRTYRFAMGYGIFWDINKTAIPNAWVNVSKFTFLEFQISAVAPANAAPTIVVQPASRTIAAGSTAVFSVEANAVPVPAYQWRRGTTNIAGETRPTLVLSGVAATAGDYNVVVTNSQGTATSANAVLTVNTVAPADAGRLINLSILTGTGPGAQILTMGATVGGQGTAGPLPLVIRGVGPTLGAAPFNVPGVLGDPTLSVFPAGSTTASQTNDNWGGTPALSAAFTAVGAFALPAVSLDSAALLNPAAGGFTVQVAGKGSATGTVIAEVYDAAGATRTAATPRLTNLSTLTSIPPSGSLAAGFVIGGVSARTVLVRAAGPTLASAFNLSGTMADPRLELYNNDTGAKISENDNWQGAAWLASTNTAVGAFALGGTNTKDAALVITLAPGAYSARVSGLNGGGGTAIIEVYEVP